MSKPNQYIKIDRLYQTPVNNPKQTESHFYFIEDGKIIFDGKILELPWNENKNRISCIPAGAYTAKKRKTSSSQFKYEHLHILNVPGREWILMHGGNYHTQILGCLLPGDEFRDINKDGVRDVLNSRKTLEKIISLMNSDEIKIIINWRNS